MINFLRGQKVSIESLCCSSSLELELFHEAPVTLDVTCFGLDLFGRLSDERYFIFYNQPQSPDGAVCLQSSAEGGATLFHLELALLPPQIDKLSFAVSIDGLRRMNELSAGYVRILSEGCEVGKFSYDGTHFQSERAIVVCEIYRKGPDWRFSAVGRGFNGGLKALVESFGGTVAGSHTAPTLPTNVSERKRSLPAPHVLKSLPTGVCSRIDGLLRQCRGDTEYLTSIYRNMYASLALYPGVADHRIKTVLSCDASGSMFDMYRNGRIQRVLDKFFAFATSVQDECSMDLFAFAAKSRQFSAVTMNNVRDYTFAEAGGFERWMALLNYQYNNESEAMRDIMMFYGALNVPTTVLFLTDGRLSSDWEIEEILIKTSRFPIYWQFVGLHGSEYGILDRLGEIDGRYTNNAGFLKMDDIDDLTDSALFEHLLHNLDAWLQELAGKKML